MNKQNIINKLNFKRHEKDYFFLRVCVVLRSGKCPVFSFEYNATD